MLEGMIAEEECEKVERDPGHGGSRGSTPSALCLGTAEEAVYDIDDHEHKREHGALAC